MKKIILSADSTCDLSNELIQKFNIDIIPLHITLGEKTYEDSVNIDRQFIFDYYDKHKVLPTTSAPNLAEYMEHFEKYNSEEYDVIHFSISSALSSSYQNSVIASQEFDNVYAIDSKNISNGIAMLILKAYEKVQEGMQAEDIYNYINSIVGKSQVSFVVDSLLFLKEGGRVSALAALSANLLNIRPSIKSYSEKDGSLNVLKKYRGNRGKVYLKYFSDLFSNTDNIDDENLFIVHSGLLDEEIQDIKQEVSKRITFKNIYVNEAGCTISSHCGKNTMGIVFMEK